MNALTFDPETWRSPDTYTGNFSPLPKASGLYAFVGITFNAALTSKVETLLYIGMSTNLANRCDFTTHQALVACRKLKQFQMIKRFFIEHPMDTILEAEKALIQAFNPPLNTQHAGVSK